MRILVFTKRWSERSPGTEHSEHEKPSSSIKRIASGFPGFLLKNRAVRELSVFIDESDDIGSQLNSPDQVCTGIRERR